MTWIYNCDEFQKEVENYVKKMTSFLKDNKCNYFIDEINVDIKFSGQQLLEIYNFSDLIDLFVKKLTDNKDFYCIYAADDDNIYVYINYLLNKHTTADVFLNNLLEKNMKPDYFETSCSFEDDEYMSNTQFIIPKNNCATKNTFIDKDIIRKVFFSIVKSKNIITDNDSDEELIFSDEMIGNL